MANYKDVESFVEWLEDTISFYENPNPIHQPISHGITMELNKVLSMIKSIPTADVVEVKHGEWKQNPWVERFYYCSECNERIEDATKMPYVNFPYCHCGAKMDGGKKNL